MFINRYLIAKCLNINRLFYLSRNRNIKNIQNYNVKEIKQKFKKKKIRKFQESKVLLMFLILPIKIFMNKIRNFIKTLNNKIKCGKIYTILN